MRIEAVFIRLFAVIWLVLLFCSSVLSQTYTISTFAGGGVPDNVAGTSFFVDATRLAGLASDRMGNIFFSYKCAVFRLDPSSGLVTRVAGTGIQGYSGDHGPAVLAQFGPVLRIAMDSNDNLYIADDHSIRKITNGIVSTIAGGDGTGEEVADGGSATNGILNQPGALAVDSAGNVYVSEVYDPRVRKISNGVITTVAGNGTEGFSGDNGPAASAELRSVSSLAMDSAGNLYIADDGNLRIRKVSNGIITTVAGMGVSNEVHLGEGGPATSATVLPNQIAADMSGNLFISDHHRIRKVTNGIITTVAGTGDPGFSGDGGPAVNAKLYNPTFMTTDPSGNLYIVDLLNYRIRKVSNGVISTAAGQGYTIAFRGSDGPARSSAFTGLIDLFVDPGGDVYFKAGYRILKVSNGVVTSVAGNGTSGSSGDDGPAMLAQLQAYPGLAVDSGGSLYVGDTNRLRKVMNGIITTIAGDGTNGQGGDGGPATLAQLTTISGVATDGAGAIYVSDLQNGRVREMSNGLITRFAGTGEFGYSGDNGPAVDAQLWGPAQIALDPAGNIFIADSGNHRIRRISNGVISTVAGNGTPGFAGDGGLATNAQLNDPSGVAVDSAGNLYIGDTVNYRVRKVSNGIITTIAGNGSGDRNTVNDGSPALASPISAVSIGVDAEGNVYAMDVLRQVIQVLRPAVSLCKYSVSPSTIQFPSSGGSFNVSVQTTPSCSWSVAGVPNWISYSAASAGFHLATVSVSVGPNVGVQRISTISIAGTLVQVTQSSPPPAINDGAIVNAASSAVGAPLAPGSLATAYGEFFLDGLQQATSTPLPGSLGGLALLFNNTFPAGLVAVTGGQANFQLPWELAGNSSASLSVAVNGQSSAPKNVNLAPFAPGIFSTNGQGTGQGAILDSSYRLVDSSNPATAGTTSIQIFCTGLGPVNNQPLTGWPALSVPLSKTPTLPTVTIGGAHATVSFSGLAPGTAGLYQVNALVPAGSAKGSSVPVTISMGSYKSNTVTIAVH